MTDFTSEDFAFNIEFLAMMTHPARFVFLLMSLSAVSARSEEFELLKPPPSSGVEIHGFASQGYFKSLENNFVQNSTHGSAKLAEFGINFTKPISDKMTVGLQLFAREFGQLGDYKAQVDWFYAGYQWSNYLGLRFGRTKLPFGLYNDVVDIDAARNPILLPPSIYPIQNRDFLLAQTGGELYGYTGLGKAGALDYRFYGGSIFLEKPVSTTVQVTEFQSPYLFGGRVIWETPINGLRLALSAQALRVDSGYTFGGGTAVALKTPIHMWIASFEYAKNNWLLSGEYSQYWVRSISSLPAVYPEGTNTSEQSYAMLSRRFTSYLQPGVYYSVLFPNIHDREGGLQKSQRDVAMTFRVDIMPNWLAKFEMHYVHGTANLSATYNDGVSPSKLSADWGIFLIKTTVYF